MPHDDRYGSPGSRQPAPAHLPADPQPPARPWRAGLVVALVALVLVCAAGVVTAVVAVRASDAPVDTRSDARPGSGPGTGADAGRRTPHQPLPEACSPVSAVRAGGLRVQNLRSSVQAGDGVSQMVCEGDLTERGRVVGLFTVVAAVFTDGAGATDPRDRASRRYADSYRSRARDGATELTGLGGKAHVTRSLPGAGRKYIQLIVVDGNLFLDTTWVLPIHTDQKATAVATAVARSYLADS